MSVITIIILFILGMIGSFVFGFEVGCYVGGENK